MPSKDLIENCLQPRTVYPNCHLTAKKKKKNKTYKTIVINTIDIDKEKN